MHHLLEDDAVDILERKKRRRVVFLMRTDNGSHIEGAESAREIAVGLLAFNATLLKITHLE